MENTSSPEQIHPTTEADRRSFWVNLYTLFFSCLGLALILVAASQVPAEKTGLLVFCSLAMLAELLSVELFSTARNSRISVSSIITLAGVMVFGPFGAAILGAAVGLVTIYTTSPSRNSDRPGSRASWIRRGLFNLGMFVTANFAAGYVYALTGGRIGDPTHLSNFLPLVLAVATNEITNVALLVGVLAIQTGRRPLEIWQQNFAWAVPLGMVSGVIGGWALASAYQMYQILGLLVFLLPVVTTSYSIRLYVNNTKAYVTQLETANQSLEKVNRLLDESNLGLLEMLGAVIDAYDVYTYGHSKQVAIYSQAIAEKMDLPKEVQLMTVRAALVHDIGKVGIAEKIISKKGPLSQEEFFMVQRHTVVGADILRRMPGLQELIPLVRHHHEHWDGSGYPAGLAGEEIPMGARILAVADSVDSMISTRPYREKQSIERVAAEIHNCAGTHYDPVVVTAFEKVLQEKGQAFFVDSGQSIDETAIEKGVGEIAKRSRYLKRSMLAD